MGIYGRMYVTGGKRPGGGGYVRRDFLYHLIDIFNNKRQH